MYLVFVFVFDFQHQKNYINKSHCFPTKMIINDWIHLINQSIVCLLCLVKKEKPKEKPKNEVKAEKAVEMPKSLPIGDKNINSTATANSKATTTGQPGTNGVQGGSGTNTDELNAYRAAIRREIERHKRYPARAKMMRKQGIVNVSFSVGADGSLSGERVAKSSGDESLDNAALEAVRSARPVGPKPAGFASSVSVPISFTIQ